MRTQRGKSGKRADARAWRRERVRTWTFEVFETGCCCERLVDGSGNQNLRPENEGMKRRCIAAFFLLWGRSIASAPAGRCVYVLMEAVDRANHANRTNRKKKSREFQAGYPRFPLFVFNYNCTEVEKILSLLENALTSIRS